ncbi:hypothetical protein BJ875DRAFT_369989 [Amylocarpus encephaloides]|uniref:Uncharacterized protein n=1 Tax=Amylocarpus encephaloides TaxID=45428 RepID=A0A9P8C837_9HELO|nr:hypothetical protein BJ875DRAFT_369989 [Amylocarpus encephaloides]
MRGSQKGAAPLTAKSGNANMPPSDKNTSSRPLMPTLSASAKVSNRPPITPRVAGSAPVAGSTPSSRRGPRSVVESNTPNIQEDLSTPVLAFLNNNITPRSGSRKVRVDSTNTTPTGTPNGTPVLASSTDSFRDAPDVTMQNPCLGAPGMDRDITKRPSVSFNTAGSDIVGQSRSPVALTPTESKFFFASDARTAPQQLARPPLQAKTSSFFYASGEPIPPPPKSSSGSAVGSSLGEERSHPKFFHANGTPDLQLSPSPHFAPPRPGSSASTSSRVTLNRAANSNPTISSPPSRPMSPSKLNQQASISSLRNAPTLQAVVLPRPPAAGRGASANNSSVARRASIESSRVVGHGRSASMGSTGPPSRNASGSSPVEVLPPSTPLNLVTSGLVSTPEEGSDSMSPDGVPETLHSPIKSGQTIEQLNELAANARKERKVLDLEITNSSLAAINRTLEREMRKQTAELRRYRRLSRSGRLSIASTSLRTSTVTLGTLKGDFTGLNLSDMSENDEEDEDEEEEFSSSASDSMDDAALSPSALAENDLRHRKKDEKRLQLDLSKHQQLLIDSQKMNQSLKRCLGWTEALISEGRKALEYQVRVSDVELGGRVLPPDEVETPEDASDNEGMSDVGARMLKEARQKVATASVPPWGEDRRNDRDSGIEIDGPQRERLVGSFGSQLPQHKQHKHMGELYD